MAELPKKAKYLHASLAHVNFEHYLTNCIKSFDELYDKKVFEEAFEQLYFALSLLEHVKDEQLKTLVLIRCVKASPILVTIKNSREIIASESLAARPENLSMCYYLLSWHALNDQDFGASIQHAKMAHFYALRIEGDRLFYECNAQLQLVCALLEANQVKDAKLYIEKFNWYMEQCKNDAELVFILSIQATLQFLEQNEDIAVALMTNLLTKFIASDNVLYTSFLAMHFKRILLMNKQHQMHYSELLQLCHTVINHYKQLTEYIPFTLADNYVIHAHQFYHEAQKLVEQSQQQQRSTMIVKFKLLQNEATALTDLLDDFAQQSVPYLLYQYAHKQFLFITSAEGFAGFDKLSSNEQFIQIIDKLVTDSTATLSFFDLYNELNLRILVKNTQLQ